MIIVDVFNILRVNLITFLSSLDFFIRNCLYLECCGEARFLLVIFGYRVLVSVDLR